LLFNAYTLTATRHWHSPPLQRVRAIVDTGNVTSGVAIPYENFF
jgi:hypothetical protein